MIPTQIQIRKYFRAMTDSDFAILDACHQKQGAFIIAGRAGMDLYPVPDGTKIADATQFRTDVGGSAGNIAVALAKAGQQASLLSSLSDDAVGDFVASHLARYGVDTSFVGRTSGVPRTSLALAETVTTNTQVVIYRNQAADLYLDPDKMAAIDFTNVKAFIVTGTALSLPQAKSDLLALAQSARQAACPVMIDIDYRPTAWHSQDDARMAFAEFVTISDVIIANDDEFAVLSGGDIAAGYQHAHHLAQSGKIILYKKGAKGCEVLAQNSQFEIGIFAVQMVKPFGAGDAFLGNVLAALAANKSVADAVRYGAAAAAIVVSQSGCASAMPDTHQLDAFMASHQDKT